MRSDYAKLTEASFVHKTRVTSHGPLRTRSPSEAAVEQLLYREYEYLAGAIKNDRAEL